MTRGSFLPKRQQPNETRQDATVYKREQKKRPTLLLGVLLGVWATKGSGVVARGGVATPEKDIVVGGTDTEKSGQKVDRRV